jgi:hypothetical protein
MKALTEVADMYSCGQLVSGSIGTQLYKSFGSELLQQCIDYPVDMLELAMKVKCDWMFKEAATNLIGRARSVFEANLTRLEKLGLQDLFLEKRAQLRETLRELEWNLLVNVTLEKDSYEPSVVRYATSLLRDFISTSVRQDWGSTMGPGYARLYRLIKKGSWKTEYPWPGIWSKFIARRCPADSLSTVLNDLNEQAARLLAPVVKDETLAKTAAGRRMDKPLTCVVIRDNELPWSSEGETTGHLSVFGAAEGSSASKRL